MAKNFDWLRERLTEIACLDDALANQRLETTGSYSCFDEPGSVRIAREILVELERTPAQAGAAGEPIAWREEIAKLIELATDINCSPHMIGARVVNGIDRYRSFLAAPPEPHAALRGLQLVQEEVSRAALAAENLARHQEQCDIDGVMVKVSRQAADETVAALETINTIVRAALSGPSAQADGATNSDGGSAASVPARMQESNDCGLAQDAERPENTTQGDRSARSVTCPSEAMRVALSARDGAHQSRRALSACPSTEREAGK